MTLIYISLLLIAAHPAAKPLGEVLLRGSLLFSWFVVPAVVIYYLIQITRHTERIAHAQERIALSQEATAATLLGLVDISLQSVTPQIKTDEAVSSYNFPTPGSGESS